MTTTSVKHRNFIGEPMGDKLVTELAGVGQVYGARLTDEGYDRAYVILGQYLLLKKDKDLFIDWLDEIAGRTQRCLPLLRDGTAQAAQTHLGMSKQHATACGDCLAEWCEQHL